MAAMPSIHGRDGEEVSLHLGKESKRKMHQGTERKTERDTEREANLRTARATTKCLWGFLVHNKVAHPPFCTIVQRPSRPPDDISAAIGIRGTRALRRPPADCVPSHGHHAHPVPEGAKCNDVQGPAKERSPGLVRFVPALAYHICLALPAAFTHPGDHLLANPSILPAVYPG